MIIIYCESLGKPALKMVMPLKELLQELQKIEEEIKKLEEGGEENEANSL
jgi:hypothetical protein